MIRLFYRYMRRVLHTQLSDQYVAGTFLYDITKWWFDLARNLILTSLFAYFAQRTGSWLAYVLAHVCSVFFMFFLFHPIFRFMIRASSSSNWKHGRATVMGLWLFINIFSVAVIVAHFLIDAMASFQAR